MKIDVVRPPAPPKPPAEVIVYLTEEEAVQLRHAIGGMKWTAILSSLYQSLAKALDSDLAHRL